MKQGLEAGETTQRGTEGSNPSTGITRLQLSINVFPALHKPEELFLEREFSHSCFIMRIALLSSLCQKGTNKTYGTESFTTDCTAFHSFC